MAAEFKSDPTNPTLFQRGLHKTNYRNLNAMYIFAVYSLIQPLESTTQEEPAGGLLKRE